MKIRASVFSDFVTRFPEVGSKLISKLLELLIGSDSDISLSWFTITSSLNLLVLMIKKSEGINAELNKKIESIYKTVLKKAASEGCPADRLKPLMKDLAQLVKLNSVVLNLNEDVDRLLELESLKSMKSLKSLVDNYHSSAASLSK